MPRLALGSGSFPAFQLSQVLAVCHCWDRVMDDNVFSPWTVTGTALSAKNSSHWDLPGERCALHFPLATGCERAPETPPKVCQCLMTQNLAQSWRGEALALEVLCCHKAGCSRGDWGDAGSPATTGDRKCLLLHYLGDLGITQSPQVRELTAPRHSAGSQRAWWESSLPLTWGKIK